MNDLRQRLAFHMQPINTKPTISSSPTPTLSRPGASYAKMPLEASSIQQSTTSNPLKRRRSSPSAPPPAHKHHKPTHHHHALSHQQQIPSATEPAPQDPIFAQSQLLRSICAALAIAGYDSVLPSALESFRAQVDEYMLSFLADVKRSMQSSRRTVPTPPDFTYALSSVGLSSGSLEPHIDLPFPAALAAPTIAPPAPAEPPPLDLGKMLGPELQNPVRSANEVEGNSYIPAHFPKLPSRHAYMSTSTFTNREENARTIREMATEEGVLAEQALRKLMAAKIRKTGATARGSGGNRGSGKGGVVKGMAREASWRDVVDDLLVEDHKAGPSQDSGVAGLGSFGSFGMDGAGDEKGEEEGRLEALMRSGGVSVNHDRGHWRRSGGAAVR